MLVGIGDLHVDKLESKIPGTADRIIETLTTVYTRGIEAGHDTFVLLGDVFDIPDPDDVFKIKLLTFLHEHRHVRTLILMGNHDFASLNSHALRVIRAFFQLGVLNGRVYVKPTLATIHGERYWFCPHPYVVPAPKPVRYCFGHFAYDGARADNGFVVQSSKAPEGRWLLGDFHTAQRGRNWMYLGSLTQLAWAEGRKKYYLDLQDTARMVRAPETYALRKLVVRHVDDLAALDNTAWWQVVITKGVRMPDNWQADYPHVVNVPYRGASKADTAAVQALIRQQTDDDPMAQLRPFLLERGVLSDRELARAMELSHSFG